MSKKKSYQSLSNQYRQTGRGFLTSEEVAAYVAARMPATKAAIKRVFEEIARRVDLPVESFVDLGAGPGTGCMAAKEVFPHLQYSTLVESNPHMISLGRQSLDAEWIESDLFQYEPEEVDCALFGYSYGELDPKKRLDLLKKVFIKSQLVVVVEPGSPRGYEHVIEARDFLLSQGGRMVAPCPHEKACPMVGKDWCHFSARVARSKEHRQLKGAELGYENEKFSYVVISKVPCHLASGRIVRHPQKKKGHVVLSICCDEGIVEKTVSKKSGDQYRKARKASWGDEFPIS